MDMSTIDDSAARRVAKAAYMREYYARPENREKKRQKDREYAAANREASRERAREWYAANKDKALARQRGYREQIQVMSRKAKSQPCQRCGGSFPIAAMEFHHRDPSIKTSEVCNASTLNRAIKELAKCDVLCAICHRLVESGEVK
jgi:hypothetical protein